jgi:hypothetical protein
MARTRKYNRQNKQLRKSHSKDMMTRMVDLYPDTGGRIVTHREGNREDWEIKSVYKHVESDGVNAPGSCYVNLILATQLPNGPFVDGYVCEGFCCDDGPVDGIPENGDGVIDINTRGWYENNGWRCHNENNGWACKSAQGDWVYYDNFGPTGHDPGCHGMDRRTCLQWERQGFCKMLNTSDVNPCSPNDNLCESEDGTFCINAVDNMARFIDISDNPVEQYGNQLVMDQIEQCCELECEGDMQTMMCESEDGVGMNCICPGACPAGGMGWGTLVCFGCEGTSTWHNQDDACTYPYYDGYWCATGVGQGYIGAC